MMHTELNLEKAFGLQGDSRAAVGLQDFQILRHRRAVDRELVPFLKTEVDFDIVCEVGFHELALVPLTVKQLVLLELAPQMTVVRRLNRLCDLGIILRQRSVRDARVHELRLAASVHPLLVRYACCIHRGNGDRLAT